jgi:4-amino-4-deoxy-L-arabinose transferase-like glycosyltransferase
MTVSHARIPTPAAAPPSAPPGQVTEGFGKNFWLPLIGVVVVAGLLYTAMAVYWVKFSRAEVFFAECAREMIVQNNMVTPLYHGQAFFDKPIWVYWLIIGMFKTFGVAHWAARVPSIIASIATLILTAVATRKVATMAGASVERANNAGLLSAMMLASSFFYFGFSYLCMSDMTLVLFDTITLLLAYMGIVNQKRRSMLWWLASVSMGFAFITKGPVGIVLPGAAILAYLAVTRQLKLIRASHVVLGGVTAALISFPWFYAAYQANGTWSLAYFFLQENIIRYAGARYDTHKPIWYMVQSLFMGFLPWCVLIPFTLKKQLPELRENVAKKLNDPKLMMWLWIAVLIGFFSFSRGKCDYYVLPVFPAVASLIALAIADQTTGKLQRSITAGGSILMVAIGALSPLLLWEFSAHAPITQWWIMPATFITCGALGLIACANKRITAAFTALFVGFAVGLSGFAMQMFPTIMASQSIADYARAIAGAPAIAQIGVHADLHHWVDELTFQSQREPSELADLAAIAHLFTSGPAVALLPDDVYAKALAEQPQLNQFGLKIIDERRVATHSLTPRYVLQRKGQIFDRTLLLVSN